MKYKQLLLSGIKLSTKYVQENLTQGYINKESFNEIANEMKRIHNDINILIELEED